MDSNEKNHHKRFGSTSSSNKHQACSLSQVSHWFIDALVGAGSPISRVLRLPQYYLVCLVYCCVPGISTHLVYVVSRAGEQLTDEADPCLFAGVRRVVRARCVGCVLGVLGVGLLKLLLSRVAEIYKAANCVEMATRYVKIYLLNIRKRNNRRGNTSQLQNLV